MDDLRFIECPAYYTFNLRMASTCTYLKSSPTTSFMGKAKATDFVGEPSSESEGEFSDAKATFTVNSDDDSGDDFGGFDSDDDKRVFLTKSAKLRPIQSHQDGDDNESDGDNESGNDRDGDDESSNGRDGDKGNAEEMDESMVKEQKRRSKKLKKLTPEQLAKEQKKIKKTGVCYLSSIPPYMKPVKLRSVLLRFGKLDRVFLKPEDPVAYQKRRKYGGNKKKKYTEGWVEFVNKKDAKICAETMNGNILGGKKSSYYHDDIINIKYLPGFKWLDLTQQIAKENEVRQAKLALEISQQQKLNKTFVSNVERSKKRKAPVQNVDSNKNQFKFDQRDIASTRADAKLEFKKQKNSENLDSVLSKVF